MVEIGAQVLCTSVPMYFRPLIMLNLLYPLNVSNNPIAKNTPVYGYTKLTILRTRRNLFFYALVTMLFLSWVRGFKIYHFFVAFIVVEDKMLEGFDLVIVMAKPT